jgi:hypothetical protein
LDVVLSPSNATTAGQKSDPLTNTSTEGNVVASRRITQPHANTPSNDNIDTPSLSPPSNVIASKGSLSFEQVVQPVQAKLIESDIEQRLVSFLPFDVQVQDRSFINQRDSPIQAIQDETVYQANEQLAACLQELNERMMENNGLASRNNDLASGIMDLVIKNNELASEKSHMMSENNALMTQMIELQEAFNVKQDEMKNLQIQALDRLALLQNSVKALLTQTYELHEYPIPRLFIVLPQDSASWNPLKLLSNKLRLYFLCECGEHTKSVNSKIPHHIHLAKHEGYDIARPNEFFQKYGPYVLTILKMLKFGISVAGVAVPAVSLLVRDDALSKATSSLKMLIGNLQTGMDQSIDYIEKVSLDEGNVVDGPLVQLGNGEALEGSDVRQLETFLKAKDENRVLGNLYRTVTVEGCIKWVCIDHYRENYHEKEAKAFRYALEALQGRFDENIGRVEVKLLSRVQAEQFYLALEKAKSVYELKVELEWDTTQSDFKKLRNTLPKTNVGVLELYLKQQDVPSRGILNRGQRYDPILDMMRHPSIQSFTIRGPCDFTKRSSLLPRDYDFSNLRHLNISLDQLKEDTAGVKCLIEKSFNLSSFVLGSSTGDTPISLGGTVGELMYAPTLRRLDIPLYQLKDDIPGLMCLVANATQLSSLALRTDALGGDNGYALQAYNAISEHRTYPIHFEEWDFCVPQPPKASSASSSTLSMADYRYLEHLLKLYSEATKEVELDSRGLVLNGDKLDELVVFVLAKATECELRGFGLRRADRLGDQFIHNIARVVAQSKLHSIVLHTNGDEGRVRILESIQWKHVQDAVIYVEPGTFETRVMKALVDGVKNVSGKVRMERFELWSERDDPIIVTVRQGDDFLQDFLASTSLRVLALGVDMTLEQVLSVVRSTDVSRLENMFLWTRGLDSVKVDTLLDSLQHAAKLEDLTLRGAHITVEQKERMKTKGITLSTN